MHPYVHNLNIHQQIKMWYHIYNGILLSHKKKGNNAKYAAAWME